MESRDNMQGQQNDQNMSNRHAKWTSKNNKTLQNCHFKVSYLETTEEKLRKNSWSQNGKKSFLQEKCSRDPGLYQEISRRD